MLPNFLNGKILFPPLQRLLCARFETEAYRTAGPCDPQMCVIDHCIQQPRVVIVGAGMAGISAASRLASAGIHNFILLEANGRPGGRVYSCRLGEEVAELGAQWIQGGSLANPLYSLACSGGLIEDKSKQKHSESPVFLTSDGRAIETETSQIGIKLFKKIREQADSLFSLGCKTKKTLRNFLIQRLQQELDQIPEELQFDVSRVVHSQLNCLKARWGTDLSQISADEYGSSLTIPGAPLWICKGMIGLIGHLLKEVPTENILYCKPVKNIYWGDPCIPLQVTCCDGECFTADYCIVTISLGVLKHNSSTIFTPELPGEKIEAIEKLGFGCVDKIFLEYETSFWAKGDGFVKFAWTSEEAEHFHHWVYGISKIEEMVTAKNVLVATVAGKEALKMEKSTEEDVAEEVTRMLRRFTGDPTIPYPIRLMRSKWGSDPHFLGSGSYLASCSKVSDQCLLGSPLPGGGEVGRVLFAGEATSPGHPGTLLGARLSGLREAERVVTLTAALNGPPPLSLPCFYDDPGLDRHASLQPEPVLAACTPFSTPFPLPDLQVPLLQSSSK